MGVGIMNENEITNIEQLDQFICEMMEMGNILEDGYRIDNISEGEKALLNNLKLKLLNTAILVDNIVEPIRL
jgi:hypothetical protein